MVLVSAPSLTDPTYRRKIFIATDAIAIILVAIAVIVIAAIVVIITARACALASTVGAFGKIRTASGMGPPQMAIENALKYRSLYAYIGIQTDRASE